MTYDPTGWFHAQWREQRRARTETTRPDDWAYEDTEAYLDDDKRYERSQEDSRVDQ